MATYNFTGFDPHAFNFLSGGRFQLDPDWDAQNDGYDFAITDDDGNFSGDTFYDEMADDRTQSAVVKDASGNVVNSGPAYLEAGYVFTDEYGAQTTIYEVEIDGQFVGYIADRPIQPGNVYTVSSSNNVGSRGPSYNSIHDQSHDSDADNYTQGTRDSDTLKGGAGDDYIRGGYGNDEIHGGTGNDTIRGEWGNDTVHGGDGADHFQISSQSGVDQIHGGEGGDDNDEISFMGSGPVTVTFTGDEKGTYTYGNGTSGTFDGIEAISGTNGNDLIDASASSVDQTIMGQDGDDTLRGGGGDDNLSGGRGNDVMTGGDGDDVFIVSDGHDTITDFNSGNSGALRDDDSSNNDFVDLSGYYDNLSELQADQADDGILNQSNATNTRGETVDYSDNSQFGPNSSLRLQGVSEDDLSRDNTGVVCFVAGTHIRTPRGDVAVEALRRGDLVRTEDGSDQPILWIDETCFEAADLVNAPKLRPIRIKPGAFGNNRALLVSQQHCVVMNDPQSGQDMFVRACHLAGETDMAHVAKGRGHVRYIHILLPFHAVVLSNGIPSESFYPGPQAVSMLAPRARRDLMAVLPGLNVGTSEQAYGARAKPVAAKRMVARLLPPIPAGVPLACDR